MASTSSATTEEGGLHSEFRVPVTRAIPVPRFATVTMHQLGKCIPCRFFAFKERGRSGPQSQSIGSRGRGRRLGGGVAATRDRSTFGKSRTVLLDVVFWIRIRCVVVLTYHFFLMCCGSGLLLSGRLRVLKATHGITSDLEICLDPLLKRHWVEETAWSSVFRPDDSWVTFMFSIIDSAVTRTMGVTKAPSASSATSVVQLKLCVAPRRCTQHVRSKKRPCCAAKLTPVPTARRPVLSSGRDQRLVADGGWVEKDENE